MEGRRLAPLTVPAADPHACTPRARLEVLSSVPFFAGLEHDEVHEVDRMCRARGVQPGERVYQQGDPARHLYVVATGAVKAGRSSADGHETVLDLLFPGDFLGTYPAAGHAAYPDTATAVLPTCVLALPSEDFSALLRRFPPVALAALEGVTLRLSRTQDTVHRLSGAPVERRLAAVLLLVADRVGEPWKDAILLQVPLTREDLAAMTGAATETVSRVISQWRREGLVETGRRWVAIRDRAALERLREGETERSRPG
ncbi:MAG TPA: Crp/Fnr family transcriptional regulator [Nocardioidaceae bacterium]